MTAGPKTSARLGKWVVTGMVVLSLSLVLWWWRHDRAEAGRTTVVWISIDGLRGDYLLQPGLPFFERLQREAAWTRRLVPVFPSVTFASHCSIATGVTPQLHGITANTFYDASVREIFSYPSDAVLLQAEPIWLTAQRQGIQTAVLDWPLSHNQKGSVRTAVFGAKFDESLTDAQRLERVLDAWKQQHSVSDPMQLRLIMGYVIGPDKAGHTYGPNSEELRSKVRESDALLATFCEQARTLWGRQRRNAHDRLFFIFTTDHGMSEVTHLVNLERLLQIPRRDPLVRTTTTGSIGHIFLDPITYPQGNEQRAKKLTELLQCALGAHREFQAWRREDMPPTWGYAHPTRCGDIIVALPKGYSFHYLSGSDAITPLTPESSGPRGMHGYDPNSNPEMLGFGAIWEASQATAQGRDLGEVTWSRLHPTVAALLRIQPAKDATAAPLRFDESPGDSSTR